MTIRVLLADDQPLIRGGLRALIDATDDLEIVGEASDGLEAVQLTRDLRADVVLMDIRMPHLDGIEATRRITTDDDLAGVKIIVLTTFEVDDYVLRAIEAGASGFVGKGIEPDQLLDAIRVVAHGEALLSPRATQALLSSLAPKTEHSATSNTAAALDPRLEVLTERERQVVALAAEGMSNDAIAEQLYVSPLTVKTHANRAMVKLNVHDRAQLVALAYQTGLVTPRPQGDDSGHP